jgi:7-carboxy-7-deazaguanine synthase
MPRQHTLKTIEIFASVQGEGLRQGEPTVFIRLSGCNLKCPFCDTKYARQGGIEMTENAIMEAVGLIRNDFPAGWICLTGGEPLIQDIGPLIRRLHREGLKAQVETNGICSPGPDADWYSVSPKPPDYAFHPGFRKKAREVKLVVGRGLSFDTVRKIRKEFPPSTPILLQPQSNADWSMKKAVKLLEKALASGLDGIRVSAQLHKIFEIK